MSRVPTVVAVVLTAGALLACFGGGPVGDAACRCRLALPDGWREETTEVGDNRLLVTHWTDDQWVSGTFIPRSERAGPRSAEVLVDYQISDDLRLPPNVPPVEEIDGQLAAIRHVGSFWFAAVPYPDGWVVLQAWTHDGTEADEAAAIAVARSMQRDGEIGRELAEGLSVPEQETARVLERPGLAVQEEIRWPASEFAPPDPFVSRPYDGPLGSMAAWQTRETDDAEAGPGVVYVRRHAGAPSAWTARRVAPLTEAGLPVMIPTFRGEAGNPGMHELLGGEVADLAAAIGAFRTRGDVDPDRVYVLGEGEGSPLAVFAAMVDDALRATLVLDDSLDLEMTRQEYPALWGERPYAADPRQDALRSPSRFAQQLVSPVWMLHGEFSSDAPQGALFAQAAQLGAGAPVHWYLVPRADVESWVPGVIEALPHRIRADDGPQADLGIDTAFAHRLAQRAWRARWGPLSAKIRDMVERLADTHLLRRERIVDVAAEMRGNVDFKPAYTEARTHLGTHVLGPPSSDAIALRAALSTLRHRGLLVRPAWPASNNAEDLAAAMANQEARGHVVITAPTLLSSVLYGEPLWLRFGGTVSGDVETAAAIGAEVMAALHDAGLSPHWNGEPGTTIGVQVAW